jgi:hypothetical protein
MALDGSPKKFAEDVATGLFNLNRSTLKRYTYAEIQKIVVGLQTVQKELRTLVVESADYQGLKDKGLKTQRINSALMAVRTYIKDNKLDSGGL